MAAGEQGSTPPTTQLYFCSLIFVDYVLICSDSPLSLLALFLLASHRFTGHRSVHVAPLCAYRPATSAFRLRHVIGLPSSPIVLAGFLVTSVVSFDMLLIIVVLKLVIRLTFLDSLSGEDKF